MSLFQYMIPKMKIKEREREDLVNRHRTLGHLQTEKVTNFKKTNKKYSNKKHRFFSWTSKL